MNWALVLVFVATATCAVAHADAGLKNPVSAASCPHHDSQQEQQTSHCEACIQEHFVRESNDFNHSDLALPLVSIAEQSASEITVIVAPEKRFVPDELILLTHRILRI